MTTEWDVLSRAKQDCVYDGPQNVPVLFNLLPVSLIQMTLNVRQVAIDDNALEIVHISNALTMVKCVLMTIQSTVLSSQVVEFCQRQGNELSWRLGMT